MEKNLSCINKKIDELLEIENILLGLSNKMMEAELKNNEEELKKLNNYYTLSLYVEHKKIDELKLEHNSFLEIIKYLKNKNYIDSYRFESIFFEDSHLPSLRIIYRLMSLGIVRNTNEKDLMNSFDEQREILESLFEYNNKNQSSNKELYGLILLEEQLARTCLYNLEKYVKESKQLMKLKHNLSYVYNYQVYEDKMTIIENNDKLEKFYKTDALTYSKVSRCYLKHMAVPIITSNMKFQNLDSNIIPTKNDILLESIIFLLDDLAVRDLKDIAISNNDESSLNIIKKASIEKYNLNPDSNFKRR